MGLEWVDLWDDRFQTFKGSLRYLGRKSPEARGTVWQDGSGFRVGGLSVVIVWMELICFATYNLAHFLNENFYTLWAQQNKEEKRIDWEYHHFGNQNEKKKALGFSTPYGAYQNCIRGLKHTQVHKCMYICTHTLPGSHTRDSDIIDWTRTMASVAFKISPGNFVRSALRTTDLDHDYAILLAGISNMTWKRQADHPKYLTSLKLGQPDMMASW